MFDQGDFIIYFVIFQGTCLGNCNGQVYNDYVKNKNKVIKISYGIV